MSGGFAVDISIAGACNYVITSAKAKTMKIVKIMSWYPINILEIA